MKKRIRRAFLALLLVGLVLTFGSVVALADPSTEGIDPFFNTHLGPVKEKPVQATPGEPGAEGDLLKGSGSDLQTGQGVLNDNLLWALAVAVLGLAAVF